MKIYFKNKGLHRENQTIIKNTGQYLNISLKSSFKLGAEIVEIWMHLSTEIVVRIRETTENILVA